MTVSATCRSLFTALRHRPFKSNPLAMQSWVPSLIFNGTFCTIRGLSKDHLESQTQPDLFEYTSGRWIYNESLRLQERRRPFNVSELQGLAAQSVSRNPSDIASFTKIGEGAANRVFLVTFRDGFKMIARIPYPASEPKGLVVASEAATLAFLHSRGLPVPKIYGYSACSENVAGTEYMFMEFSQGQRLSDIWYALDEAGLKKFISGLVELEARLMNISLPAFGSLYFQRDIPEDAEKKVAVEPGDASRPDSFYVGPSTALHLWHGKRQKLSVDRGPFLKPEAVLSSGAEKEICYLTRFGRPLLPFHRIFREHLGLEKQLPSVHLRNLAKYIKIAEYMIPRPTELSRPALGHPDLRPSNVFVSKDLQITSLIDWQHANILPLYLQCGIPDDLDNTKDPVSRSLDKPELPPNFNGLTDEEQYRELGLLRKRQLHYFYITETASKNKTHFDALTYPLVIGRKEVFNLASAPWQGDNVALQSSLIFIKQNWESFSDLPCPIAFTEEEESECLRLDDLEQVSAVAWQEIHDELGIGPDGWVANERYEDVKRTVKELKKDSLEEAETEFDRRVIREHWLYDDMDEDEYD